MKHLFFGGIHPKENKRLAEHKPLQTFPEPDILVIPMGQHIGAPCLPLVKKGDTVTMGQKIGDNQGLCVPVHASVSGKVKAVEMRPHTSGTTMMSVVIENDHQDTLCPDIQKRTHEQIEALTPQEMMDIIREAEQEGSEAAVMLQAIYYKEATDKTGQEEFLIRASEKYPFLYLELGDMYARNYRTSGDFADIRTAMEYYYTADAHGMLGPKHASILLGIYDYHGEKGMLKCSKQEKERLQTLARRAY